MKLAVPDAPAGESRATIKNAASSICRGQCLAVRNIERPQPFGIGIHFVEFILQIGLHPAKFSPQVFNQLIIDLGFLAVDIRNDIRRRGHVSVA
jgi:hypothetical protein